MFQGSRHIQFEFILEHKRPLDSEPGEFREMVYSGGSVLFDVDTGKILDPSHPSILLCFLNLQYPSDPYFTSAGYYESFDASGQIVRVMSCHGNINGSENSFNRTQYEIIERCNDPQYAMLSIVDDDNDCDHRTDNGNKESEDSLFISIANPQTSCCDNYLLPAIGGSDRSDCPVLLYAHGLLITDKRSGLMLKVEPGTTGCRKWMTLDGGANGIHTFVIAEDGSRLLGLTGAAGKILLQEWETSMGTFCCEHVYDCPDFNYGPSVYFHCQMSPDGSKIAISQWKQTYILGIPSGSSADIVDLMNMGDLAWFPDSKRIAYIQSEHGHCDLVVQCLASNQITTIHCWYTYSPSGSILITPDGSRMITTSGEFKVSFWTWDVSDL